VTARPLRSVSAKSETAPYVPRTSSVPSAGPRRVQLELLDDERGPVLVLHGGAHARSIAHEGLAPLPDVGTPVPERSPISGRRGTSDPWGTRTGRSRGTPTPPRRDAPTCRSEAGPGCRHRRPGRRCGRLRSARTGSSASVPRAAIVDRVPALSRDSRRRPHAPRRARPTRGPDNRLEYSQIHRRLATAEGSQDA